MRIIQATQTDFLFLFFDLSWMNDSPLSGFKLVRFAHNWNTGILGSGEMENWVVVKFLLTRIK